MAGGSTARVTAVANSTASQPNSIASAASLAVPMPASRTTGTSAWATIISMLCGLAIPSPVPIGEPSGITAAQPVSSSRLASTGSSLVYGSTTKPSSTNSSAALTNSTASGSSVRSSAITSSFTQSVCSASRANCAVSTASAALRHPAVLGSGVMPSRVNSSSTPVPLVASTRRMATVVSSVPDATRDSSSTVRLVAPPVPMISRDVKLRPAMVSLESATLHRRHDFYPGAVGKRCVPVRSGNHRPIQRYRNALVGEPELFEQGGNGGVIVDLHPFVVDRDDHAAPTKPSNTTTIL